MPDAHWRLPRVLREAGGLGAGSTDADLRIAAADTTVGAALGSLARDHPGIARRIRDETGAVRRYVNVYVDGTDIRALDGLATAVAPGATVQVIQSVAGG